MTESTSFLSLVVFLHVISAVLWIGGMIAIRFAVHYSIQNIVEPKIKIERTLENLKRFFNMVIPAIVTLLITAIILIIMLGFNETQLYSFIIIKEVIWAIMSLVFIIIFIKRNKAEKKFIEGDYITAKNLLLPIARYYIPLNIVLGIIAVYIGVILRGF